MRLPSIPRPLGALLAALPQYPPAVAAAVLIDVALGGVLNGANLPAAENKVVCIHVRDAGLRLLFYVRREGVAACHGAQPDLTISASANDFLALAARTEDADTLFFSRRLVMEGDTELGLLVKNTLDALDPGAFRPRIPAPGAVLKALKLQLLGGPSRAA